MRVCVHDFSGHPFPLQLSRELAVRGHTVLHVHCPSYATGKGPFDEPQPAGLTIRPVAMGGTFARYSPLRRLGQELRYGIDFVRVVRKWRPDVVVSCGDPLFAKAIFGAWALVARQPWLYWLQDLYSLAMARHAGWLGRRSARLFMTIEGRLLRSSSAVIAITPDFLPTLAAWGVPLERCAVIENWAPLDEIPERPRANRWRAEHGLGERFAFLYAGTLGLKHNPDLLHNLANECPEAEVIVVSEGLGAERLAGLQAERQLANLRVLPYQLFADLADMLGAADVLVVILEDSAGEFSVPSKILTYLCAGRPLLASMPKTNLGARVIAEAGAGIVADDERGFLDGARRLVDDARCREVAGRSARRYAENHFRIGRIADDFEIALTFARRLHPFQSLRRKTDPATPLPLRLSRGDDGARAVQAQ